MEAAPEAARRTSHRESGSRCFVATQYLRDELEWAACQTPTYAIVGDAVVRDGDVPSVRVAVQVEVL